MKLKGECFYCHKSVKGRLCTVCKSVRYCDNICQHADWDIEHRFICGKTLGMRPEYEFVFNRYFSFSVANFQSHEEYRKLDRDVLNDMAAQGDIEVEIYLDFLMGFNAMNNSHPIPEKALQALKRSSERGCPLSQLRLAEYLLKDDRQDVEALALFMSSAKMGLIDSHSMLGIAVINERELS
jgi:TPR repeat protein